MGHGCTKATQDAPLADDAEVGFVMHQDLRQGKVTVDSWPLCEVLLVDESHYPGWLVLVPRRAGVEELVQLSRADQALLMNEIDRASRIFQKVAKPDKVNIGALGNVVSQLHVHIVPRLKTDLAWPGPVWGAHPLKPFGKGKLGKTVEQLKAAVLVVV